MKTKLLVLFLAISTLSYSQFWTEKSTSFAVAARGIYQITIANSNIAWARAYDGSGNGDDSAKREFTKTVDGGETWSTGVIDLGSVNSGLGISDFFALDGNTAWIVMNGSTLFNRGGVFKTTDGGVSWIEQTTALYTDGVAFPNVVYFWNSNNGFCQGDPVNGYFELYTTTDGGSSWTRVPSANIPTPITGEYGYTGQIEVVNNRMWWTTNKGRIFRSDDHGLTHVAFQSPIADFGGGADTTGSGNISFFNENDGLLINNTGNVWTTSNGGETWTPLTTSGNVFPNSFTCIKGSTTVVSCNIDSSNAGSSYSLDGGVTWIDIDTIQHGDITAKEGLILSGGFTSTDTPPTGGIFKYTGTELPLSTKDNTITTFKAYPNPVKDILTIEGVDTITNVTIFNMLGQKVLNVNPNNSNATINMNSLNNGTYFAKVTINGATETMKIIK